MARASSDLEPRNAYEEKHGRPSKMKRLVEMAEGRTMQMLLDSFLNNADENDQPTIPDKRPLFKLDHILVSKNNIVPADYRVHAATGLSDHRAISANILTHWHEVPGVIPRNLGF